jgi:hypothetical protein
VVLVVAGGASDADTRLLNELIDAYGVRPHTRVHPNFMARLKPDLLAGADIALSVTDNTQETFGLSLLECLGAGLPVVASRFDGYKDLVADGVDGFLVDTWWCRADPLDGLVDVMDPNVAQLIQAQSVAVDLPQLADRLVRLVDDAALRRSMGTRGREKVRREYRFSAVIARYEAEWDRLAAAASLQGRRAAAAPGYDLAPSHVFDSYPTEMLDAGTRVVATAGAPLDPRYVELAPLVDAALLEEVVARASQPVAIGELVACAAQASRGWFAVMWLLKYGALRRL